MTISVRPCHRGPVAVPQNIQVSEEFLQRVGSHRLHQVAVEASELRTAQVLFLPVPRQGDEDETLTPGALPYLPGDLVTAHTGETNIEQDHVISVGVEGLDRCKAVVRHAGLVTPRPE